jgi:hypothetical protein
MNAVTTSLRTLAAGQMLLDRDGGGATASTEHPSNLATTARHFLADCLSLETPC